MKLYTFIDNGQERVGAEAADGQIVDLAMAAGIRNGIAPPAFNSMQELIDGGIAAREAAAQVLADPPENSLRPRQLLQLAAPLPRPRKIRGFSVFEQHLKQSSEGVARLLAAAAADPAAAYAASRKAFNLDNIPSPGWYRTPVYYYMDVSTVTGHDTTVTWPAYSNWIDYELEIAAVIGTSGKDIPRERANEHIFGYTIVNDLSARDAQLEAMATGLGVAKGKDFDNSNPMGPCIVTADEIADPYALRVRVRINGEEWSSNTGKDARWRFDECIAYASRSQIIHAGELFSTGTIPNCSSIELIRRVSRGSTVELEVEGIGVLRTFVQ
jgi:2-keto-4-pentenoate hydratase/2-oxohepta-3-ene-1,7-dioic acid hydratase in catechol pathway